MLPREYRGHRCPKRQRLLEMLVQSVPFILTGNSWEDHNALEQLEETLGATLEEARLVLRLAIEEFPGLKIINTGTL